MDMVSELVAKLLVLGMLIGPSTTDRAPGEGAYKRLSPADQRIARALYEAQAINTTPVASAGVAGRSVPVKPFTRDEIAARRQKDRDWGHVFLHMQSRGLLQAKDLDEVIGRHRLREESSRRPAQEARNDRTARAQ